MLRTPFRFLWFFLFLILGAWAFRASVPEGLAAGDEKEWEKLNRKAAEYYQQGFIAEAMKTAGDALDYAKTQLGETHPAVIKSLNNLAVLHVGEKQYAEAEEKYLEMIRLEEARSGPDSPELAEYLLNLGKLYYLEKKYSKADEIFSRLLARAEKMFGPEDPRVIPALRNLVLLYVEMGLSEEAKRFEERVKAIESANPV